MNLYVEVKSEEERDFFRVMGNFLLQQKQKSNRKKTVLNEKYIVIVGVNGTGKSTLYQT